MLWLKGQHFTGTAGCVLVVKQPGRSLDLPLES